MSPSGCHRFPCHPLGRSFVKVLSKLHASAGHALCHPAGAALAGQQCPPRARRSRHPRPWLSSALAVGPPAVSVPGGAAAPAPHAPLLRGPSLGAPCRDCSPWAWPCYRRKVRRRRCSGTAPTCRVDAPLPAGQSGRLARPGLPPKAARSAAPAWCARHVARLRFRRRAGAPRPPGLPPPGLPVGELAARHTGWKHLVVFGGAGDGQKGDFHS